MVLRGVLVGEGYGIHLKIPQQSSTPISTKLITKMSNLRFVLFPATLLFIMALAIGQSVDAAYTYQKLNELMPELRQFLGRTHLGTLRPLSGQQRVGGPFASFMDDDQFQASKRMARATFRERKSNNLRNLMRIGKRRVPPAAVGMMAPNVEDPSSPQLGPNAGMGGAVYYFSPNFPNDNQFQAYRPQSVWL